MKQFLLFFTIFCYLLLDFHVFAGTRFSLRDKRLFEISEVEITRVSCTLSYGRFFFVCLFLYAVSLKSLDPEDNLGPAVQSVVSLTGSLRVISLTVLADSIHNILICFAEKMCSSTAKATHIFSAKYFSIFAYHSIKILTNR